MPIKVFTGQHSFLSNFYFHPMQVNGKFWPTLEHAYQAMKTVDPDWQQRIREAETPKIAKRLGRQCPLVIGWDGAKLHVMRELLRVKFFPSTQLADFLLITSDEELIEGNYWHDNFFGACICPGCSSIEKLNHLGKLLMERRAELRELYSKDISRSIQTS